MSRRIPILILLLVGCLFWSVDSKAGAIELKQERFEKEAVIELGNYDFHLDGMGLLMFLKEISSDLEMLGTAGKTLREFDEFEQALLETKELRINDYKTVVRFAKIYLSESIHAGDIRIFDVKENMYLKKLKAKKYSDDSASGYKFVSVETKEEVYSYITSANSSTSF